MVIILAIIGALALLVWFIRSIGLKRISLEFEPKPVIQINRQVKDAEPPNQLHD